MQLRSFEVDGANGSVVRVARKDDNGPVEAFRNGSRFLQFPPLSAPGYSEAVVCVAEAVFGVSTRKGVRRVAATTSMVYDLGLLIERVVLA